MKKSAQVQSPGPAQVQPVSRRAAMQGLAGMGAGLSLSLGALSRGRAQVSTQVTAAQPETTGPEPNPYWNAVGPLVLQPQKVPLIQLTDRPVQLETPRPYFHSAITPNAAFFVRWHLAMHPRAVDLSAWRLRVEGHVARPVSYSLAELLKLFRPSTVVAVNQCAGNSRSRFFPRVPGSQWGSGGMGCAEWTGVRLRELLTRAGLQPGAQRVQFEGLDRAPGDDGPKGFAAYRKSLAVTGTLGASGDGLDDAILAYAMNGEPLPLLNGFPLRLVVPGYFGTYWVKALGTVRVLPGPDESYWMTRAYQIPARPGALLGHLPPEGAATAFPKVPLSRMPVRSFLISPDGSSKIPVGMPVTLRGVAFSGFERIARVEVSTDGGSTWAAAQLGLDLGKYAFRTFSHRWVPARPGPAMLAVRAFDLKGNGQSDAALWNPGGYLWNRIERQEVMIGTV